MTAEPIDPILEALDVAEEEGVDVDEAREDYETALATITNLRAANREAREALEKITARAHPARDLDGTAAAAALDSVYRWARKGLGRGSRQPTAG